MRPQRRVQRYNTRPSYTRRPVAPVRPRRQARPTVTVSGLADHLQKLSIPALPAGLRPLRLRIAIIAAAAILIVIIVSQATAIHRIRIQGNHIMSSAEVTRLVQAGVQRQWLSSLLFINGGDLAAYLESADLGIKQASVQSQLPHTLVVTIQERQPTLNWRTGGVTYLLDSNATVIGPTTPEYAKLPTVTDSSNLPVKAGDRVAPTQFVVFCATLAHLLPATGYSVTTMTVPESTSEVYVTTQNGLVLKFDTTRSAEEEIGDLKAVQAELSAAHVTPTQYIDLRIPNKAYYK